MRLPKIRNFIKVKTLSKNNIKNYNQQLLIDSREPVTIIKKIIDNCGNLIDIRRLKTGDYVSDDMEVAVERKTMKDFAASLISEKKRLWTQFDRLKKEFKHPYIVIGGRISDLESEVSAHAILGAVAFLASHGVTVVQIDNNKDLVYLILKIFENHGKLRMINELQDI